MPILTMFSVLCSAFTVRVLKSTFARASSSVMTISMLSPPMPWDMHIIGRPRIVPPMAWNSRLDTL